jgi:Fe-S cluster assembly protein SufD
MLQLIETPRDIKAWDRFLELGLPTKESEVYRYVRFKELYSRPFYPPHAFQPTRKAESGTLVFVNGAYSAALSHIPEPLIALPLSQAFRVYGNFLNPRLQKQLKEEKDPFAALNSAYFSEGLFLYLPPKSMCEVPLNIEHVIDHVAQPTLLCPRIHLFAGREAQARFCFSQKNAYAHVWVNSVIDLALEDGAYVALTTLASQHEGAHDFLALRATLKERSVFKSYGVSNGAATSRQDYAIHLLGANAEASLYGVWGLKGNRQHHVNVWMDHQRPSCTSLQKFKGVVADSSRSSFEGKIYVHQEAQKTEAYQMNNNLVLSERASAYAKPNLEIFADDVKASHGATVGQLDEEQLFYLTTRGCPLPLARTLLVRGFTREMIDLMEDQKTKEQALEVIA